VVKIYGKCVCGRGSATDPARKLTALPDPQLDLRGSLHGRGRGGGKEEEEMK